MVQTRPVIAQRVTYIFYIMHYTLVCTYACIIYICMNVCTCLHKYAFLDIEDVKMVYLNSGIMMIQREIKK